MTGHRFHGIYPMLYAFFAENGALDHSAMARQVEGCISGGVHGLAVGGLATECGKLSNEEKRQLCVWVLEAAGGRVPVSVTISEATTNAQIEMALLAADNGAQWVVLQPPPVKEISEEDLIAFFGKVADASPVPVGIQNAPQFIGIGLSNWGLIELNKRHPNVSILKAEGDAMYSAALAEEASGAFDLFNGRNGVDLIDTLHAGFAGVIPSPDATDAQARVYDLLRAGEQEEAERVFREIAPLLGFLMLSIDHLLCYGKRLTARRLGLDDVHDRAPADAPTAYGLETLERWSRHLGPMGG